MLGKIKVLVVVGYLDPRESQLKARNAALAAMKLPHEWYEPMARSLKFHFGKRS